MATTPASIVWVGQGPVYIGNYDPINGTPEMGYLTQLYRVGCGSRTLGTTLSRETKKIKESCSGQRLDFMEIETGKSLEVKLELVQFDRRTLAMAFFGVGQLESSGNIAAEILPIVGSGDYVFLKHPKTSAIVVKDNAGTVLTEGVDWRIDSAAHGGLLIINAPAGPLQPLSVSYSYDDYARIAAFSATQVQKGIVFNGFNQSGQHARVILPRVSLGMDGDFAWLGDEESTLSLSGSALYVPELAVDDAWGGFMRIDALPV